MCKLNKLFLTLLVALLVSLSQTNLNASSAYPGLINFIQPDSTKIRIFLKGDEKVKWAETEDGYTILFNSKGFYEYAVIQNNTDLIPSGVVAKNIEERTQNTTTILSSVQKHIRYSPSQVSMVKQIWKISQTDRENSNKAFPQTGSRKLVCLLIGFPDKAFTKTQTDFNNLFNQVGYSANSATGSVHDFFAESSYNQLNLSVTVAGPFTAANNMAYYGGNSGGQGTDLRPRELIAEAINLADPTVNFADFDNDNDGTVDGVYVIYAGYGEEGGGGANCIWAHAWNLVTPLVKDGKTISKYSCSSELSGVSGTITTAIGVICHEFGHVLGAPDYYDTDYETNGQYAGTGYWDLQASGSWNNNGRTPAQPNAYTKCYIYNWATATVISGAQTVTLNNSTQNSGSFFRYNTLTSNEFFLLENKQKLGFDGYVPGNGMLVYHVDENYIKANPSSINAGSHQGMYIIPASSTVANGIIVSDLVTLNSAGASFPGSTGKTAFTDTTTPNSISWAGTNTAKPITAVLEDNSTKTITLDFMGGTIGIAPTIQATNFSSSSITNNSMTLSWTRGNGNAVLVIAKAYREVNEIPGGANYIASSVFGNGTQLGNGNYVVYNGTGNSVTLSSLVAGTTYYYAIYEYNTAPNTYLTHALTGNTSTTGTCSYCISSGTVKYSTSITSVGLNTINNVTAKPAGYNDYSGLTTTVTKNSTYNLTVKLNTDGDFEIHAFAWIDWNHNCDFSDPGEIYDLGYATNVTSGITSLSPLNISVPSTALLGNTRMRISAKFGIDPTPCESNFDGEVEDYTINVVTPCVPPTIQATTFTSSTIANNSMTLGWTRGNGNAVIVVARAGSAVDVDPSGGTSYIANSAFGSGTQIGTGNFVIYNGTGSSVNLTSLTSAMNYYYSIYEYNSTTNCYLGSAEKLSQYLNIKLDENRLFGL